MTLDDTITTNQSTGLPPAERNAYSRTLAALVAAADPAIWVHPAIEPLYVPGKGSAFRATRAIAPNTDLLRVAPRALLNVSSTKLGSSLDCAGLSAHQHLAYFLTTLFEEKKDEGLRTSSRSTSSQRSNTPTTDDLILELDDGRVYVPRASSSESKDKIMLAYLRTLPTNYANMPISWPTEHIPKDLRASVTLQRRTLASDYDTVCGAIRRSFPDSTIQQPSRALFQWAWLTVNTRSLYIAVTPHASTNLTLAPAIDLLNHTAEPHRASSMRWDRLRGMTIYSGPGVEYGPGDEVCITYGHHPNAFLLREYGFVLDGNPHDSVDLTPALPELQREEDDDDIELKKPQAHLSLSTRPGSAFDNIQKTGSHVVRDLLESLGYNGEYTLAASEPHISFRTTVAAVALAYPGNARLVEQLAMGLSDESRYEAEVRKIVSEAISDRKDQLEAQKEFLSDDDEDEDDADDTKSLCCQLFTGWLAILDAVELSFQVKGV
ncbi:uncharacterized protein SAPINGB_P000834 [Magnusiomyces paraingens]|uniref:Uncharacterized protein n=1 Tax=Magnusiomyces paraingens TaxID=2606893 RepID=A0A5E8B2L6_9ASCO|nr:uncharacterized protein SAPINGB_P000834 [Saprochaete ingens]VVT45674.1 unnamed protein product [Saprochaete ingens]